MHRKQEEGPGWRSGRSSSTPVRRERSIPLSPTMQHLFHTFPHERTRKPGSAPAIPCGWWVSDRGTRWGEIRPDDARAVAPGARATRVAGFGPFRPRGVRWGGTSWEGSVRRPSARARVEVPAPVIGAKGGCPPLRPAAAHRLPRGRTLLGFAYGLLPPAPPAAVRPARGVLRRGRGPDRGLRLVVDLEQLQQRVGDRSGGAAARVGPGLRRGAGAPRRATSPPTPRRSPARSCARATRAGRSSG